jgi:DNA-binding beta-propeller fold protein YncE
MNMANFLMPENTAVPEVTDDAQHAGVTREDAVAVRRGPIGDIAGDAGSILVANHGDDSVSLLRARTLEAGGVIGVPGEPVAVVVCDDRAYVSSTTQEFDAVSVIDTNTTSVIAMYSLAFSVTALAISPDGKRVYAGRTADGSVDLAVIDTTAERVGTIAIANGPGVGIDAVKVDPTGTRLYVAITDARGSSVAIVDAETAQVTRSVWIGSPIRDIGIADGTAYVLTSDLTRGSAVQVIDLSTDKIIDTIELGVGAPTQMVLSPDGSRAYVVDYDRVSVICTLTHEIVNTITVDARPSCVALDPTSGRLYVADFAGGVSMFTVDSTMPELYSQFMATDPIAVPVLRELTPA